MNGGAYYWLFFVPSIFKVFWKQLDNAKFGAILILLAENSAARRQEYDGTRSRPCEAG
jgi:hypothetical protein